MLFLGNISWGLGSVLKVQVSLASGDHHDLQTAKEAVVHGFLGSEVKTMGILSAQGMDSCLSNILLDVSWASIQPTLHTEGTVLTLHQIPRIDERTENLE